MYFKLRLLVLFLFCLCTLPFAIAQKFPCDGSFYISQNTSGSRTTTLEKIVLNGSSATFERLASYPLFINAIGFNPIDHYIYAIEKDTRQIVRIFSNGNYTKIGMADGLLTNQSIAGAFTNDGIYIIQDINASKLLFYEVTPEVKLIASIEHSWGPNEPLNGVYRGVIADFAIHPYDPEHLYFHIQNTSNSGNSATIKGKVARININSNSTDFGKIKTSYKVPDDVILQIGSMFFGSDGNLYGYGSKVEPLRQRNLVKINTSTGLSEMIATGPVSQNSDGCSCPVKVDLTKSVIDHYRSCDTVFINYQLQLINQGIISFTGLTLIDKLSINSKFTDLSNGEQIWDDGTINLSQGNSLLRIEDFSINPNDTLSLNFWVQYIGDKDSYANQAYLKGFTDFAENIILSDDPQTELKPDSTVLDLDSFNIPVLRIDTTICHDKEFSLIDSTYEKSGRYTQVLPESSLDGCDSMIILELTVASKVESFLEKHLCFNEEFYFNEERIESSGIYHDTLISQSGCDSFINLELTISPELNIWGDTIYFDQEKCDPIQTNLSIDFFADSIVWSPSQGLSCRNCLNPEIQAENSLDFNVTIYDSTGCSASSNIKINIDDSEGTNYHIPNVFTPTNRDEINDYFTLFSNECIVNIEELRIYDRWGNLIFETYNIPPNVPELGWEGFFKGKLMAKGTFVYHIRAKLYDGSFTILSGDISLL